MELTDKQKRFCDEYLIDFNATQAAIRAGYSKKTANEQGARMLAKVSVQTYIKGRQEKLTSKLEITQERVLLEYARVGFIDIRKFFDENNALKNISDIDDDSAAALAGLEVTEETDWVDGVKVNTGFTKKIKTYDKVKALDSLGKHLGLFEADNRQKGQPLNLSVLGTDELKQMLGLLKKVNGN